LIDHSEIQWAGSQQKESDSKHFVAPAVAAEVVAQPVAVADADAVEVVEDSVAVAAAVEVVAQPVAVAAAVEVVEDSVVPAVAAEVVEKSVAPAVAVKVVAQFDAYTVVWAEHMELFVESVAAVAQFVASAAAAVVHIVVGVRTGLEHAEPSKLAAVAAVAE
jgi:hypothetical protein